MRIRKRGKMDSRVPELTLKTEEVLEICDKYLQSQGIKTGKRSCVQVIDKKDKRKINFVFQVDVRASLQKEDFRVRLQWERDELLERMDKLKNFMRSDKYKSLPKVDRDDLREQLGHMLPYLDVLNRRVARLCYAF